jgi:acyl transferase domain-containing protein/NADPH:quinone reductase-like Zn-dependent oxidoreductase
MQGDNKNAGEPIAVVGMACKFPGAPDIASLLRLLERGGNAITKGDPGSGVGRIGQFYPRSAAQYPACSYAALVDDIDLFDAEFFRISPVEAQLLDPQQRMTLETCWQALEDAGIDPEQLRNTRSGVYIGVTNNDYRGMNLAAASQISEPAASLYAVSGTSFNTVAGRVAYVLGLEGPAIALDTACSSSLVAVHQAASVLWQGGADLMLVGGTQAIFNGRLTQLRAQAGMLSPEGQCKAFDSSANGFVRGEGCGIVVLKRLSDAEADGDPVWGVILGSAINQDGASAGLTVPSAPAQVKVIEEALREAGIAPAEVDYLEAHGTGTEVGDPIELNSAAEAYGKGRPSDRPLLVGSIKTNMGHLEPTAGIAGFMKAVLSLRQGVIPRHLHFENPNPRVDWDNLPVRITDQKMDWPPTDGRPPRAGISSYGWSGTNAHVIVEGYGQPVREQLADGEVAWPGGGPLSIGEAASAGEVGVIQTVGAMDGRPARLLPLSGKSGAALRDLAQTYLDWLGEHSEESGLADLAWSASVARTHFDFRDGVVFRDGGTLREGLAAIADSAEAVPPPKRGRVAFVYTGQGNQWVGMGEALYKQEPAFRDVMDRCDRFIQEERGVSLLDVMFGRTGAQENLDEPRWTQPAIYALECALTALWRSVGIEPVAVLGHSLGEIAAAQAAGVFSLEEGMKFASARGRLMGSLPQAGAMSAVFAPAPTVAKAVEAWKGLNPGSNVCIGVDNGSHQVISGPVEEVHALADQLELDGVNVRRLRPSPAYHSPLVEPALEELEAVFNDISVHQPSITLVSNVTGQPAGREQQMDGVYWREHARSPVQFRRCVETLAEELGIDAVIELGPHAILGPLVSVNWPQGAGTATTPVVLQSLLRPSFDGSEPERADAFLSAVAGAYKASLPVDFKGLYAGEERRKINIPGYPFQRRRFWAPAPQRRVSDDSHPLLGTRHESPRGEVMYETDMFPSDPAWLADHRVYGRVIMPGAVFGVMAAAVPWTEGATGVVVEELQLLNPLVYPELDGEDAEPEPGKRVQLVVDGPRGSSSRSFEIFSKGEGEEGWTAHAEGRLAPLDQRALEAERVDLDALKARLAQQDLAAYYRTKAATGIDFGPAFRTLQALWGTDGEAIGEIGLQASITGNDTGLHPLLLDGCFQVLSAARHLSDLGGEATYLPFAWERLWLNGPAPDRLVCHARLRDVNAKEAQLASAASTPETLTGDLWFYSHEGITLGGLTGFTVKRATRASLLSTTEELQDLLYEVVWRERPLLDRLRPADELTDPTSIAAETGIFAEYLAREGVEISDRAELLNDLERLSRAYALAAFCQLGWERQPGTTVAPELLRAQLGVLPEHSILFERMLRLLGDAGVLERDGSNYKVKIGTGDPLPDEALADSDAFNDRLTARHLHGAVELGLLRRSGGALAEVLQGDISPLSILFPREGPGIADYYFTAPASRATNRLLGEAVAAAVANWPEDRPLRILEVGAGTGSGTSVVLPELRPGNFTYMFTDISAGFFAEAENRFGDSGAHIEYRPLDIERNPGDQGFDPNAYDLVIAVNVLHATRNLGETLANCRELLAPSGKLIAVENLRGRGWQDMVFGQLDGWWRFSDQYRPDHALASPEVWRRALADTGYVESAVLGGEGGADERPLGSGVILAEGPREVKRPAGVWVVAGGERTFSQDMASALAQQNQTVVLASPEPEIAKTEGAKGIRHETVEPDDRNSWRRVLESLPGNLPLTGVVHCFATEGHGVQASTEEMADDVRRAGESALALAQALQDADISLDKGLWFITKGALGLERDYMRGSAGELAGAALWGFGKVVAREAAQLCPRTVDLDPAGQDNMGNLVNELMFPDPETQVAYRDGSRLAARLVRSGSARARIDLPEERPWRLMPGAGGGLEGLQAGPAPGQSLEPGQVRVAVEAVGINFLDVLLSMGVVTSAEPLLGEEFCGRIVETGPHVKEFAVGDRVVGLGFGTFGPEVVTTAELVAPALEGMPAAALTTIPSAFVSAGLSFDTAGLKAGDRVLIHTASGGVGLAAVQLAQSVGAEVFATASRPKQAYLRSLGIKHVFDSRSTDFGRQILEATSGAGVNMVLNSLTGSGFIEASLSCLGDGGCFVEMGRRDIWTVEEMAASRPDVAYSILELDYLKKNEPSLPGGVLRRVMEKIAVGKLKPLAHTRWPVVEAGAAMEFMRSARHIGKNVLVLPGLTDGRLRPDRSYLVTGGLGGIGTVVARWLAERGAGVIVLNGRRPPDSEAQAVIDSLRQQGADVRVELADMTDPVAIDEMLARIDANLPPLAGIIHSVGVLSDGSLGNQTWERFELVLWPKVLGAWHLHRATLDRDLDLFVLFSSITGVVGNSGQGNHAAANAFLDQLAAYRRSLGLPGQSIAWGAWSGLGEAEEQRERIQRQLEAAGTGWLSPQQGLRAFEELVRQDMTFGMAASVDWPALAGNFEEPPPFLAELLPKEDEDNQTAAERTADLVSQLRSLTKDAWEQALVPYLQRELQAVLRMPTAPAPNVRFFDLGMDSLMSVELRNRLNRTLAGEYVVSNTAVFDYPNITALAGHLGAELGQVLGSAIVGAAEVPTPQRSEHPVSTDEDAIAIVGMACRFPGAPDLESSWDLLENGRDAITDGRPPGGPWDGVTGDPAAQEAIFRRGGFIEDLDRFDNRFFRISPLEARMMDPQQRLLLETTWHALEDAGLDPESLRGSRTGVFAGIGTSEYREVISASGQDDLYFGTSPSLTAGRIAFVLGLEGPAMPVDMACASSLAAVHQAAAALWRGEVDLALTGGVNTTLSLPIARFHRDMGMLSALGRCNAFDAGADGFVRSEGCGVLVLKRLSQAEIDGDRIWGVVKGTAINQSGASAALPVPNGPAQERAMEEALARAGAAPADVDYLEAHGTGTELGDSIELRALASVYGRGRQSERPLLLGSVKTNIGHAEWASGMASIIKVIMAMQKGVIPAHLHFNDPNPNLDWEQMPVQVTTEKMAWPAVPERPPRSAVNSFGMSGANGHVVLEGYPRPSNSDGPAREIAWPSGSGQSAPVCLPSRPGDATEHVDPLQARAARILPLSGKSPEALRDLARAYLSWLDSADSQKGMEVNAESWLADAAWTAGTGRSHFPHRAGLVFKGSTDLRAGLKSVLEESGRANQPGAGESTNVAFVYPGPARQWSSFGEMLYRTEPVFRSVLDRCDELHRLERGESLLGLMFGNEESGASPWRQEWENAANYSLQVALTALWESAGVRPRTVLGQGTGEIAAAHTAGMLTLEDGLRLAASLTGPDAALPIVPVAAPSITLVSSVTGSQMQNPGELDNAHWRRLAAGIGAFPDGQDGMEGMDILAGTGVNLVVKLGPVENFDRVDKTIRVPVVNCPRSSHGDPADGSEDFARAVASAYEAGAPVNFRALFGGEERSRIAIPGYPFQRRSFWVQRRRETQ